MLGGWSSLKMASPPALCSNGIGGEKRETGAHYFYCSWAVPSGLGRGRPNFWSFGITIITSMDISPRLTLFSNALRMQDEGSNAFHGSGNYPLVLRY